MTAGSVVLLSGGTGGAKLARGLLDVADDLVVVANTGDDVEIYGVHVAPDPDLIAYWLADVIDDRGYGVRDDSWTVMEALASGGREIWFNLGDRDLAYCLMRTELLRAGRTLTEAHAAVVDALGVRARVLPMSDSPVPTRVLVGADWLPFQEFMILRRGAAPDGVEFAGASAAAPTPEVLSAIASASAILIGPSNPVISIGPLLALPGLRDALAAAVAPVVAVSPFVGGAVLKGPTAAFCDWAGIKQSAAGVAGWYGSIVDGVVADEPVAELPALEIDTRMDTAADRVRVAGAALEFATSLTA
jgi:LPPG:FO 2-phospho-L-lactate transferase